MLELFERTQLLLGEEAMEKLERSRVIIFGLGGVGGYVVEALARCGVGSFDLVDSDRISRSNINRQILATHKTVGKYKAEVAAERVAEINPRAIARAFPVFYGPETASQFDLSQFDYVVDAIDTVTGKLSIIRQAKIAGTPVISSMGAGNKLDPTAFRVADIYETSVCPLARTMRSELRRIGIDSLKVVYSKEEPLAPQGGEDEENPARRSPTPGSVSFVPSVAGLILASEVVKDLIR